ncbi:hypothetical protein IK110_02170 [Candidatus Saccharibacteria bacterium]|nr:hypothetical protein [Candidatus Saccharibacteria bacterium]
MSSKAKDKLSQKITDYLIFWYTSMIFGVLINYSAIAVNSLWQTRNYAEIKIIEVCYILLTIYAILCMILVARKLGRRFIYISNIIVGSLFLIAAALQLFNKSNSEMGANELVIFFRLIIAIFYLSTGMLFAKSKAAKEYFGRKRPTPKGIL